MTTPQTTEKTYDWKALVDEERAKEVPPYVPVDYRFNSGKKEMETVGDFYTPS